LRVFATKWFARFARDEGINDERLCEAVTRAATGSIDARPGGDLIKQRVSRAGSGRSGGFRTLIAFQATQRSVFLYGFAKNERDNISSTNLAELKVLAKKYMALSDAELNSLLHLAEIREIACGRWEEKG
jgi:hypothetical protein